jgi:hypothetical protein
LIDRGANRRFVAMIQIGDQRSEPFGFHS